MDRPVIRAFAGVAATLLAAAVAVPAAGTPSATPQRAGNFKIDKIHYRRALRSTASTSSSRTAQRRNAR
jgi:hypothetical protein